MIKPNAGRVKEKSTVYAAITGFLNYICLSSHLRFSDCSNKVHTVLLFGDFLIDKKIN